MLLIANSGHIGGGDKVLMDLITGFDPGRFRPILVVPALGALSEWAEANNVRCVLDPAGDWEGRAGLLRRTLSLARIVVGERARVVHASAHTCYRAAGLAGRMTGAVRVCHLGFPPTLEELQYAFRSIPNVVIGCYGKQIEDIARLWPTLARQTQLVSIVNAVDTTVFFPEPVQRLSQFRFGARHVVVIVGHLSKVKGHPVFVQAAARIAARVPDCAFVAVGSDTVDRGYKGELEAMAVAVGIDRQLHFVGWHSSVADILRAADVVVQPSRAEGLPLAVLEAMACGKPVVATPVGGVPEAVVDGVTGVLVDPDDAEAAAEAVIKMLCDDAFARNLGDAARRRVEERFSKPRFVAEVEELYSRLLS